MLRLVQSKQHKLSPPWEGPFVISKVLNNGSYYLLDLRDLKKDPTKKSGKRKRHVDDDLEETKCP